jgi:hypothetical protein
VDRALSAAADRVELRMRADASPEAIRELRSAIERWRLSGDSRRAELVIIRADGVPL